LENLSIISNSLNPAQAHAKKIFIKDIQNINIISGKKSLINKIHIMKIINDKIILIWLLMKIMKETEILK
jgi:hypothetical protein